MHTQLKLNRARMRYDGMVWRNLHEIDGIPHIYHIARSPRGSYATALSISVAYPGFEQGGAELCTRS